MNSYECVEPSERTKFAIEYLGIVNANQGVRSRHLVVVHRRWAAMVLLREDGWSLPAIARYLGLQDHTTVMYGLAQSAHEPRVQDLIAQAKAAALKRDAFSDWLKRYLEFCTAKEELAFNGAVRLGDELVRMMS